MDSQQKENRHNLGRQNYLEEILRQVSTQSALIAGFSFAGLAIDIAISQNILRLIFTVVLAITIASEILALFLAGILIFVSKISSLDDEKWARSFSISWFSYLVGLLTFLISVCLLIWIKVPGLGVPISIFTGLLVTFMIIEFRKIGLRESR